MIDSVLKGTGNSRFLKSAVPAGTSWADALAMLQAGTFPVDFNGINTEGFQQVGTPLNKANLLKDATAAQIGLPPSTTPDGMFQALGNTGELHVWRKTVKNAADVPAGYNLGTKTTKTILNTNDNSGGVSTIYYSGSVSVSDSGTVSLKNPASTGVDIYTSSLPIVGKFFYIRLSTVQTSDLIQEKIYFVPSDADISVGNSPKAFSGVVQEVTGYPLTPAGTTTTYPVSTNPKAYQEGDDAKAAGYVVGDVVSGHFGMGMRYSGISYEYYLADELSVDENGVVSLKNPQNDFIGQSSGHPGSAADWQSTISGKYIQLYKGPSNNSSNSVMSGPFHTIPSSIVYIPNDAAVTLENVEKDYDYYYIDRYQPVTGYPAIPAGTTIKYLGKLGDKARVQVVSYVGTGTYGADNPNSLTFDFVPKLLFVMMSDTTYTSDGPHPYANGWVNMFVWAYGVSNTFVNRYTLYLKQNNKTISWYSGASSECQCNWKNIRYTAIAIG